MFLLNFGEKTMAAEIKWPSFYEEIYGVLEDYLSPNLADKHAKKISEYLDETRVFPADGIYTICNGKLFTLIYGKWCDTESTLEDYYLKEDSPSFDCLNGYDEEISCRIKTVAIKLSKEIFSRKMYPCNTIDIEWGGKITVTNNEHSITETMGAFLRQFFSEKMIPTVTEKIWSEIFGISDEKGLVLVRYETVTSCFLVSNEETYEEIPESFQKRLRSYILRYLMDDVLVEDFISRLRNIMKYRMNTKDSIDYVEGEYAYRKSGGRIARFLNPGFTSDPSWRHSWFVRSEDVMADLLGGAPVISSENENFLYIKIPESDLLLKLYRDYTDNSVELDCQTEDGDVIIQEDGHIDLSEKEYFFNHIKFAKWSAKKGELQVKKTVANDVMSVSGGVVWLECVVNS